MWPRADSARPRQNQGVEVSPRQVVGVKVLVSVRRTAIEDPLLGIMVDPALTGFAIEG